MPVKGVSSSLGVVLAMVVGCGGGGEEGESAATGTIVHYE